MKMPNMYISENIKNNRERLGLTKEELGKRVGVSDVTIGYWESGKTTPRMKHVQKLAGIFGVDWDELIIKEPIGSVEDVLNTIPGLSEERKKALEIVMQLSDTDLALLMPIMERTLKTDQ